MVSSIEGAKVTKRDMCPKGKTTPPQLRRVSWSLVVSQRTEQKREDSFPYFNEGEVVDEVREVLPVRLLIGRRILQ